jgi:hypothetical protein
MNFFRTLFQQQPSVRDAGLLHVFPNDDEDNPLEALESICRKVVDSDNRHNNMLVKVEGQGQGGREDSYVCRHVVLFRKVIFAGDPLSPELSNQLSSENGVTVLKNRCGLDCTTVSPAELAKILNILFLDYFKLKQFSDSSGTYYCVTAYSSPSNR